MTREVITLFLMIESAAEQYGLEMTSTSLPDERKEFYFVVIATAPEEHKQTTIRQTLRAQYPNCDIGWTGSCMDHKVLERRLHPHSAYANANGFTMCIVEPVYK